jgi:hypothetical protein
MSDLDDFLARYNSNGEHPVTTIDLGPEADAIHPSPFIIVRSGDRAVLLNPLAFTDHLCIDVHSFVEGDKATAGVFGMTDGKRWALPDTGATSHGWASTALVSVLVGEQS